MPRQSRNGEGRKPNCTNITLVIPKEQDGSQTNIDAITLPQFLSIVSRPQWISVANVQFRAPNIKVLLTPIVAALDKILSTACVNAMSNFETSFS